MYPRHHFAMQQQQQSSVAGGSSAAAMPLLHGRQPTCASVAMPGGSQFIGAPSLCDTSIDWAGGGGGSEDVSFAQVYRFVGDMFDADAPVPVEAHLQKLKEMDNITTKTVLLVLRNLENNLSAPQFEP
ncbi:hypothetical protein ZEAMMB73_Zm00001d032105, partial [Zea mays]